MTGREFAKLARVHLLPALPGFTLHGGYLYLAPVERLWRRFALESSGFSRERFTIACAVSPLYCPGSAPALTSGLGGRLGWLAPKRADRWWEWQPGDAANEAQIMAEIRDLMLEVGVPFLASCTTPADVADRLAAERTEDDDPHVVEARAYSLILDGRYDEARDDLVHLRTITLEDEERAEWWAREIGHGEDWVIALGRRGERVREALDRDADEAVALLDRWAEAERAELPAAIRGE